MREALFALVLLVASACVVAGVAQYAPGVAWVVAGVLLASIGWLILGDDTDAPAVDALEVDG